MKPTHTYCEAFQILKNDNHDINVFL